MLTLNTGSTFQEGIKPQIEILAAQYTPYLNKYRTMTKIGSREIWYNESLSNNKVTLDSAYTAGSGSMVLEAPTLLNPFKVTANVTRIESQDGSAVWKVTAWNSGTNTATITLEYGSDANQADATVLYMTKYDTYGADFGSGDGDELQFSTTDINYPTFIYHRIKSASGNEEGKFLTVGVDEAQISHQEKKLYTQNIVQLERNLFYSVKAAGSSPATRQSNTITAGLNSKAAGLATLINGQGGRVVDNTSTSAVSEADIIADIEYVREVGGLTNMMSFDRGENNMGVVDIYCSEKTLSDINKFVRLERDQKALSSQTNGVFGSWSTRLIGNGCYANITVTSGVKDNDYFIVPANADIKHKFIYFFDKVQIGKTGHNEKLMYVTGYTTCAANAFSFVHRKNLARL